MLNMLLVYLRANASKRTHPIMYSDPYADYACAAAAVGVTGVAARNSASDTPATTPSAVTKHFLPEDSVTACLCGTGRAGSNTRGLTDTTSMAVCSMPEVDKQVSVTIAHVSSNQIFNESSYDERLNMIISFN